MTWIRRAVDAVRRLLLRRRVERDLDEELAAYLDAAITRGMTGGLDRTAAERAARVEMGSTEAIKESVRAVGWESLVDGVVQDLRYAWRRLRAAPVFSLVAVLMLALGIGANTAIFSLVNGLLLRAVPGATIDRLAVVTETDRGVANIFRGTTSDERRALETTPASPFDGVFTSDVLLGALTGNGHVELVTGETVSGTYFSALGVTPAAGRLLVSADDHDSEGAPIVISDRLWQRWFSGSPTAIGTVVHMAGYPLTVVGIAPARFRGTWLPTILAVDFWIPSAIADHVKTVQGQIVQRSADVHHRTFAQLKPGVSPGQAKAATAAIGRALHPDNPRDGLGAETAIKGIVFDEYATPGLLIGTALVSLSVLVFLIACANLTNLLLARNRTRTVEVAIRLATGAGRSRIFRLLFVETALVTAIGAVAAVAITFGGTALMARVPMPRLDGITIAFDPSPDVHVFVYALLVAMSAALAVGMVPALRASRTEPLHVLASAAASGDTRRGTRVRGALVAAQVMMSVILLLAAGLYVRSASEATRFDFGYDTAHGAIASINLAYDRIDDARGAAVERHLVEAARRIPNVTHALLVGGLFGSKLTTSFLVAEGQVLDRRGFGTFATVSPGFFAALGVPLQGREFSDSDDASAPGVVIVSQNLARRLWPGEPPIGHRLSLDKDGPLWTVVGVVGSRAATAPTALPPPDFYVPAAQRYSASASIIVTSAIPPDTLVEPLQHALHAAEPDIAILDTDTLAHSAGILLAPIRWAALVLGALAALGLAIAILGIYGATAFLVSQRTREFGVRRALGATGGDIYAMVLGTGLRIVLAGVVPGIVVSLLAANLLRHLLFGIAPHDALTFTLVPTGLIAVSVVAAAAAARRAVRVDPNVALRDL